MTMDQNISHIALIPGEGVFILRIEQPFGPVDWAYMLSEIRATPDDRAYYALSLPTYEAAYEHAKDLVERRGGEMLDPQDVVEFFSRFWEQMPPA